MAEVLNGFRWCILGRERPIHRQGFIVGLIITIFFFLWLGVSPFRKMETTFTGLT
jgi:ABC-type polysaccharide/polyol phosphate export permease